MSAKEKKKGGLKKLFGSRFKAGSYSAFAAAVVIVIAVFANLIVNALPSSATQLDMTGSEIYTLSDQTKRIVSSLDKDVTLYLLAVTGNEDETITRLLDRYKSLSDHIKVETVDPNEKPTFLNAYDLKTTQLYANSVLVDCGGRYRLVGYDEIYVTQYSMDYSTYNYTSTTDFDGENALTNAIHYVSRDDLPKVYTLTGHGEEELSDSLADAVEKDNFETESLSLMTAESIPEDASVIVINNPERDLNEDEAKLIIDWLANGGNVALTTSYIKKDEMPNLLSVAESMGLTAVDGIVVESDSQMYYPRYPYYLLPTIGSHEITEALISGGYYILAPVSQGIAETGDGTAAVTWLLTTSDSAYAKPAGLDMTTYEREDGDTDGPFHVAAVSEKNGGKLLWIASQGFLQDSVDRVVSGANSDLYLNALNWMSDVEENISIRAKSLDNASLTVPSASNTMWSIILIGLVPALMAGIGILIRVRRKKR